MFSVSVSHFQQLPTTLNTVRYTSVLYVVTANIAYCWIPEVFLDHIEFGLYISTNNAAFEPSYTDCINILLTGKGQLIMEGTCHLCARKGQLRLSHVIPKFVYSWTKESCPSFLRNSKEPNLRIQDGEKQHLLCSDCEQRLGIWEKAFYETVFVPLHENKKNPIELKYDRWGLKFAVSVSWRNLLYHRQHPELFAGHLSKIQLNLADRALDAWRQFLLGNREHPGQYEQHILPLDIIDNHTVPFLSPCINRYFIRAIDMDLLRADDTVFTFTKMNRIAIFGFIEMKERNKWRGTKVHLKKGVVGTTNYFIPEYVLRYLSNRANEIAASFGRTSAKQSAKITESIMNDPVRAANSEVFRAMAQDVALFGDSAFGGVSTNNKNSDNDPS
jgi:hypothetical protein